MNNPPTKRKIRVSLLIGSLGAGGKERQLLYLIQSLSKEYPVQLIVFREDIFYQEIRNCPISLTVINRKDRYSIKTIAKVYKELSRFKPDVVHTWGNVFHCIALPYLGTHKVKIINGSIRYAGKIKKKFITKILQKIAFASSHTIVSNSRAGLSVENLLSSTKADMIYNGFDLNSYAKDQFTLPDDIENRINKFQTSVTMVGRFFALKDYLTFVRAAKIVARNHPETAFFCIGDGPHRLPAEEEAGPLKDQNIFFLGKRDDVQQIIRAFDIGVMLNNTNGHAEGISNAIMEYMAAGLPVVATNAGGTPELVKDNESGFLVPAFDPEIAASRIMTLLKDEKKRKRMGQRGQEIIENDFNIDKMASAYIALYNGLLNDKQVN